MLREHPRPRPFKRVCIPLPHALLAGILLACASTLASCANTLQDRPEGPSSLERVIVKSRFPVYWLGASFAGMQITAVTIDPGEAVTVAYGDCTVGGQYTCVTPLSIVTSPNNSFVPGGATPSRRIAVRGVTATADQDERTLSIPTGGVVVSVFANRSSLAAAAANMMVPLNKVGLPLSRLPARMGDTGFDRVPLASQIPAGASIPTVPNQ
jgi:hypothetical protein